MDAGKSVDIIYMDFKKAFDTVPHRRLLSKIQAHRIQGPVLNWIRGFLTKRHQRVIINGSLSEEAAVSSGIPQGSVLGPILFVMYINDLPNKVNNTAKLFAGDTKLYAVRDQPSAAASLRQPW